MLYYTISYYTYTYIILDNITVYYSIPHGIEEASWLAGGLKQKLATVGHERWRRALNLALPLTVREENSYNMFPYSLQ